MGARGSQPRASNVATWILQLLLVAAFALAGAAKLIGAADMVAIFESVGVGQWLRYVTGAIEIAGAVLLLLPGRAAWGAALLAATMVGALATHLFLIGGSAVPALVLLTIALVVLWLRRDQFENRLQELTAPGAR